MKLFDMRQEAFLRSKFRKLFNHESFEAFEQKLKQSQGIKYPLSVKGFFKGSNENSLLSKMILWWLRNAGHVCYWTPGNKSTSGDVYAIIGEFSCFYKMDVNQDRLNASQDKFKQGIIKAGAHYVICHSFDDFLKHYKSINPNHEKSNHSPEQKSN